MILIDTPRQAPRFSRGEHDTWSPNIVCCLPPPFSSHPLTSFILLALLSFSLSSSFSLCLSGLPPSPPPSPPSLPSLLLPISTSVQVCIYNTSLPSLCVVLRGSVCVSCAQRAKQDGRRLRNGDVSLPGDCGLQEAAARLRRGKRRDQEVALRIRRRWNVSS